MTPERYKQVGQLYHQALEFEGDERDAFLERACGADESLRREVESLIASHEEQESFLTAPAFDVVAKQMAEETALSINQQIGNQQIGHYRIISLLGKGGMGEIYLAQDTRLGRNVALKLLPARFTQDDDRLRRFVQEAKAASALNHPHIVTIHEIGEDVLGRFIVMELVEGRTLRAMDKPCPIDTLVNLGGQIARALSATHAAGITHRDIKPDNIMARDDGYVKILDFGLARLIPATATDSEAVTLVQNTAPGALLGTVAYMSPEQARGETVMNATDIFSLGIVFYEMTTGQHPFKADTMIGFLHAIASQSPLLPSQLNPEIPPELDALILRMLEKDGGLRPTAREVDQTLNELYGNRGSGQLQRPAAKLAGSRHTVGREKERAELRAGFESARDVRGQLLCVTGEPGIGKTTLVEDFLAELAAERQCAIARGRCSERLAGTEAYLPLLEALESLLQDGSNPAVARALKQVAPTWYAQIVPMPGDGEESPRALEEVKAASQERMKRELGAFLQQVARLRPLVLFFDDLHWADVSTIDMLSFLAGKFDALNTLIVMAYRPSDMLLAKSPFLQIKPDLQARGVCRELRLGFLNEAEIEQYLALEFPRHRFPAELHKLIHAKTEGSPLFMADLARDLRARSVIVQMSGVWTLAQALPDIEREAPESVRGMIERKIAQLSEDNRRLLTVASVQGYEFDSAVVAQVLNLDADEVEERLEKLERIFAFVKLTDQTEFPNRALTLKYRFVHVLYQNALYAALRATRKAGLSAAVAQTLLEFYGAQSHSVAGELANLFEVARDFAKSAEYFAVAAQQATQVFANTEAIALARRGLNALQSLPAGADRDRQELALQLTLGLSLASKTFWAAPEVGDVHRRARELCQRQAGNPQFFQVLTGLWTNHVIRAEMEAASELAWQALQLAEEAQDSFMLELAHCFSGITMHHLGEFIAAGKHFEAAISLYRPGRNLPYQTLMAPDVGAASESSRNLWILGYPEQALRRVQQAYDMANSQSNPGTRGFALVFAAFIHQFRREEAACQEKAEAAITLSREKDISDNVLWASFSYGWAIVRQARHGGFEEGLARLRESATIGQLIGTELAFPQFLAMTAEACACAGQIEEALRCVDEALAITARNSDRYYDAELHRLRGELLLVSGAAREEAESCFRQAIEIAKQQSAKSWELRAATSLARLWCRQGKTTEAQRMLAETYGWFTEGFDTADLKEARALLDELQHGFATE